MVHSICSRCCASLRRAAQFSQRGRSFKPNNNRQHFHIISKLDKNRTRDHIDDMLMGTSWSVKSLLPDSEKHPAKEKITPEKLHHLLRLSALPLPKSGEEEASMLKTLHSQLHFVRDIQQVDTRGIEPLQSIRDETEDARVRNTIGLDSLKDALDGETIQGRNKRPRRRIGEKVDTQGAEDWDVFSTPEEKVVGPGGKYFVVRSKSGKEI